MHRTIIGSMRCWHIITMIRIQRFPFQLAIFIMIKLFSKNNEFIYIKERVKNPTADGGKWTHPSVNIELWANQRSLYLAVVPIPAPGFDNQYILSMSEQSSSKKGWLAHSSLHRHTHTKPCVKNSKWPLNCWRLVRDLRRSLRVKLKHASSTLHHTHTSTHYA